MVLPRRLPPLLRPLGACPLALSALRRSLLLSSCPLCVPQTAPKVLLVALAEILLLGAAPYAATNCAVDSVRRLARPRAAALVNAVLRKALRAQEAGTFPDPLTAVEEEAARALRNGSSEEAAAAPVSPAEVERLADGYSLPSWVVQRWVARFGRVEAAALMEATNRVPSYGIRPTSGSLADLSAELERRAAEERGNNLSQLATHTPHHSKETRGAVVADEQ